jgi:hypothetical protein
MRMNCTWNFCYELLLAVFIVTCFICNWNRKVPENFIRKHERFQRIEYLQEESDNSLRLKELFYF